jgi:ribosome-associated translation inhibitor RaiA
MVATAIGKRTAGNGTNSNGTPTLGFEFHSPDIQIPPDVVQYTKDKLNVRLGKYGRWVMGAIVHMRDLNGPKGGVGFACHLEARLSGLEPVNVEERDADLRAAIDQAIDRLDVVVGRHVGKARPAPRHKGDKLARAGETAG